MHLLAGIIGMITLMIVYNYVSTYYQGIVCAKLPFEPFSWLQNISHRNLEGKYSYFEG